MLSISIWWMAGIVSQQHVQHAISRGGDMSRVMVGVHDWGPARTNFFVLKRIADIIHQSKNLAVLKLKPNISDRDIHDLWKSHIWDRR